MFLSAARNISQINHHNILYFVRGADKYADNCCPPFWLLCPGSHICGVPADADGVACHSADHRSFKCYLRDEAGRQYGFHQHDAVYHYHHRRYDLPTN